MNTIERIYRLIKHAERPAHREELIGEPGHSKFVDVPQMRVTCIVLGQFTYREVMRDATGPYIYDLGRGQLLGRPIVVGYQAADQSSTDFIYLVTEVDHGAV